MNRAVRKREVMKRALVGRGGVVLIGCAAVAGAAPAWSADAPVSANVTPAAQAAAPTISTVPGMPPVIDARNLYSEAGAGKVSAALSGDLERIYVPNLRSNDVYVVDPNAMKVEIGRAHV